MPKVLITGASGGIGTALSAALVEKGHELVVSQNNSLRIEESAYFEQFSHPENIAVIYHLAAETFVPDSWKDPSRFLKVNVLGSQNVLEFCRKYKIQLVYVSSYAYGSPKYLPIDEEHPVSAVNPYGLSKLMGEEICAFYGDHYDLSYLIVRPFNVFGMLRNRKLLIPEIIGQIHHNKNITVKDLTPKRDYIFIDDLIAFLVKICGLANNQVYNIGSGKSYSVAEIIATCQAVYQTNLPVKTEKMERKNEIPETRANINKARIDFGWIPEFSLEDGIRKMKERLENNN